MIISNLAGGLGNQMFQYACARSLALDLGQELKFAVDQFDVYSSHNGYELERVFGLMLSFASSREIGHQVGYFRRSPSARRVLGSRKLRALAGPNFITEPSMSYWPELRVRAQKGGYLQGYWQSERYFASHAAEVRKDFSFRGELQGRNLEMALRMRELPAISLHVRRGDYVTSEKTNALHGTCSPEYYKKASARLLQQYPQARIFAFSDDPVWVKQCLQPGFPTLTVVDQNLGENSYFDMWLMSLCDHHIIANSSFSWWGAWLNSNPGKVVIAPSRWFADGKDAGDLIPSDWERI